MSSCAASGAAKVTGRKTWSIFINTSGSKRKSAEDTLQQIATM